MANPPPSHARKRPSASRRLSVGVKTAKGRTVSSKLWLERQLNDPYVQEAKRLGYRSRSAFKLQEIDDRERFLKPGLRVVDLGACPGGWSQVASERVGSSLGKERVVAIDFHTTDPIPGVLFLKQDFLEPGATEALRQLLSGQKADVVISDMAAHATGHRQTDHLKSVALCEAAFEFACVILNPGGVFLCKVLQGGTENSLLTQVKKFFKIVKHIKPPASRKDSAELFLFAKGYRGHA